MCEILSWEFVVYEEDYFAKMFFSLRELTLWLGVTVLEVRPVLLMITLNFVLLFYFFVKILASNNK